jgi:hypothetical protein
VLSVLLQYNNSDYLPLVSSNSSCYDVNKQTDQIYMFVKSF